MPPLCARRLPRWYGERMRRKVQAGAGVESLRARCAWFYDVAQRLHALEGAPPDVGPFAAATSARATGCAPAQAPWGPGVIPAHRGGFGVPAAQCWMVSSGLLGLAGDAVLGYFRQPVAPWEKWAFQV